MDHLYVCAVHLMTQIIYGLFNAFNVEASELKGSQIDQIKLLTLTNFLRLSEMFKKYVTYVEHKCTVVNIILLLIDKIEMMLNVSCV